MSYIIHLSQKGHREMKTIADQWRWALEYDLKRSFNGISEIEVTKGLVLFQNSNAFDTASVHDWLLVVHTDATFDEVCALWSMTGDVCYSITKYTGTELLFGDEWIIPVRFHSRQDEASIPPAPGEREWFYNRKYDSVEWRTI